MSIRSIFFPQTQGTTKTKSRGKRGVPRLTEKGNGNGRWAVTSTRGEGEGSDTYMCLHRKRHLLAVTGLVSDV